MTRDHYFRTVCAAHLAELGKTMFVYANDNETTLPRAASLWATWKWTPNWAAADRSTAYGLADDGNGGKATINACFYLLVKYYQSPTGLFVCPGDNGTTEFSLADIVDSAGIGPGFDLTDAWDFGPPATSYKSCSFAYHHPFTPYNLTTSRDPNLAVAADRNPWFISPAGAASTFAEFEPDIGPYTGDADTARVGNSASHLKDGQNVLFLDGRVAFETRAYCGLDQDNIYTESDWIPRGSPRGVEPTVAQAIPWHGRDSILVHDPNYFPNTTYRRGR